MYEKSFGNQGICMLQVAKSLLCRPEQSLATVFGNRSYRINSILNLLQLLIFSPDKTIMQIENFSQTQQPDFASQKLLDTLQDIVNNVQIHSNFCIRHPNYKPLELPEEVPSTSSECLQIFRISI